MYSIVLLASSMAPCRIVLTSQLIEKISLEYNNHPMTHQKAQNMFFLLNYNQQGHTLPNIMETSVCAVIVQGLGI